MTAKKAVLIASIIGTTVGATVLTKNYFGGPTYSGPRHAENKVVIITGSNTGIGKETAREFAKMNARVIMACRAMERCEKARKEIVLETKNPHVYCRPLDLASQDSIRSFVERFKQEEKRLDILINNAGVMRCPLSYTKEGIEMQLGVNHMGHFLLTNLLLDMLKASAPSRIVNVSSLAHERGKINTDDLNSEKSYDSGIAYDQSKLANILFTRELARRLEGTGVTAYALHPGIVDTELMRHLTSTFSSFMLKPVVWIFIKSPLQGAQTTLYTALDPSIANESGKYYADCKEVEMAPQAKDDVTARWLWATSEKWTHLSS